MSRTEPALLDPLDAGIDALLAVQREDGAWEGEMVWCPVITAQYAITARIVGIELPKAQRDGFVRYLRHVQREDGSWGLHDDAPGSLFVTALATVALRLLGEPDPKGVAWIRAQGGVEAIPTWGKAWLAMLGLYGWEGVQPIPPEIWLLPDASPIHPRRFYCHTRLILLGLGILCARRPVADLPERDALRDELYLRPYDAIDFRALRSRIRAEELYAPPTPTLKAGQALLRGLDRAVPRRLRERAIARCLDHVRYELRTTDHACISPVSGLLNVLALFGDGDPEWRGALRGLDHWLWQDSDGLRLVGARSHAWDTAFAVQALADAPGVEPALSRAFAWLDANQIQTENPDFATRYRDPRLGGWCFSDARHAWPVSDCTAEVLVALRIIASRTGDRIAPERIADAVRFILHRRNPDGGFGSYEAQRGALFDGINATEMYGRCMTERSYVECTASCVRGLLAAIDLGIPADLTAAARAAIADAVAHLRARQNPDGSWTGVWGIQFVYGTFFAVHALREAGVSTDDPAITRAAAWLRGARLPDGGFSETWQSCLTVQFEAGTSAHAVQTAWGVLALHHCGHPDQAGVAALERLQHADGTWPEQQVEGVFFNTSALRYRLYRATFPLWALASQPR